MSDKDVLLTMEFTCYQPIPKERGGDDATDEQMVKEAIRLFKELWLNPTAPDYRIEFSGQIIKPYHDYSHQPTLIAANNRTGDDQGTSR